MSVFLAPMEGLVDPLMRDLLTRIGGVDRCVTEFIRVSDRVLPARAIRRLAPELDQGGATAVGVPVRVQLLGSDPALLAATAARAAELGAPGIDLNFGCPAKTVNRSLGGAVLLQYPERIGDIVAAVRAAVPADCPVTAKMRLGFADKLLAIDNAQAMAGAGASEICVHARTKVEGYRPPAHWEWIARIREQVPCRVIANGEVWSVEDYLRCAQVSGCQTIMIGRGLVGCPDLGRQIQRHLAGQDPAPMSWLELLPWIISYFDRLNEVVDRRYAPGRLKQWLVLLKRTYPEAQALFDRIRAETVVAVLRAALVSDLAESGQEARPGGWLYHAPAQFPPLTVARA